MSAREVNKMEEQKESILPFIVMLVTLAIGVIVLVSMVFFGN